MTMTKQTVKTLAVGRSDTFKLKPADITVVPGFNVRAEDEEWRAHIDQLKESIRANGVLEPLTVAYNKALDRTELRHGHCRLTAVKELIAEGLEIKSVDVRTEGRVNDAEAVLQIAVRNEGKPLRPIELAQVYKRLEAYGWAVSMIAEKVGRSASHVSQLLQLTEAPEAVQQAVRAGKVSASLASQTVRDHGAEAPAVIEGAVKAAKREGKTRATARHIQSGPRRTKENFELLVDALQAIAEGRGPAREVARQALKELALDPAEAGRSAA